MDKRYLSARIARFLLLAVLIICAVQAQAFAEATEEIDLEKIVVTNRRTAIGLSEATENVAVIDAEEIQKLPARDLGEALKYVAGIDLEPRQGFGRDTPISIQGSDSRQVRVMIDGIPLNSQSSGQVNPAIFPLENIERIEVIKGAASGIWGSGLGGVINVITKDTGTTRIPQGSLTSSFAEFRTRKESAELSGKIEELGYYLFSSYMESGGKGPKDDVLEKKAFAKLDYDLKDMGKITGSFGYSQADVNNGELPDGTWSAQPYRMRYGKVGWEGKLSAAEVKIDLKHSRQEIVTRSYLSVEDEAPDSRITFNDLLYQLSLNSALHPREKDLLVLGADFDCDILKSTYLTKAKSLRLQAPYANYTLKLEPWDWNFGLRYDHNSEYGQEVSPSLGCAYHLPDIADTLIRANVSRAFNAPPLMWKFYERTALGVTADNPGIKPERAWVYELGLESQPIPRFWWKVSLYRADVSDAISNAQNAESKWIKKNFQKFRRQGAELQFKINLLTGLDFFAAAAFNDIEDRVTRKTVRDAGKTRQSFDLRLDYKNKKGFGLSLLGLYNYWNAHGSLQANDRKMLCDLKASQDWKNLSLFFNIHNLTNSKYWQDYYYPAHQRYFEGGMTLKW